MSGKSPNDEGTVTPDDLKQKWNDLKGAVLGQAEHRVRGVSSLALGGILIGVGALGLTYWLGRRSAHPERSQPPCGSTTVAAEKPLQPVSAGAGIRLSQAVEPALARALDGVVQIGLEALTKRLRGADGGA